MNAIYALKVLAIRHPSSIFFSTSSTSTCHHLLFSCAALDFGRERAYVFTVYATFFQFDADLSCVCFIVFDIFLSFFVADTFFLSLSISAAGSFSTSSSSVWYFLHSLVCLLALVVSFILCLATHNGDAIAGPDTDTDARAQPCNNEHYLFIIFWWYQKLRWCSS